FQPVGDLPVVKRTALTPPGAEVQRAGCRMYDLRGSTHLSLKPPASSLLRLPHFLHRASPNTAIVAKRQCAQARRTSHAPDEPAPSAIAGQDSDCVLTLPYTTALGRRWSGP